MNKKKTIVCYIVLLVFLLTACGKEEEPKAGEPCIYYVNAEGTGLVRRAYEFTGDSKEEEVENALAEMGKEQDSIDYQSTLPQGVSVEKWEFDDTILLLYFDKEYEELDRERELLLRAGVVQTVTQIAGVDGVEFFIDGTSLVNSDGQEVGYMRAEDFVQNTGSSLHSYQKGDFRLYFANEKGDRLVPKDISVRYNSNMSAEKVIVEKLLKGPSGDGAYGVISPKTEVLSVSVKEGICYVNFNEEFLNAEYKVDPYVTIYALVNSIVESGAAGQVQILVNGETNVMYRGSVDLGKPFSADYDYVEETD